ncbi:MAG: histidine phosphatase family protein [Dehalogenimonas sp.]|uniref:phosphoglycerate mutase (2,3-diphosphoglycerate-dependent) n=1 Tax=Candidatus Dehalogenimonas loeffleri TaxID=3127115 RepID=A0ABZ2J2X4_9CHLR|nr:histidine phosphatase family protein [Dehalogenimonas sp.]
MKLILVRHGDTATDDSGKCYGATDIDLSEKGQQQALALQQSFAEIKIDAIYSGTLKRGVKTANTIAGVHGVTVVKAPELNEVNFGLIEGLTFNDARLQFPDVAESWQLGSQDLCFPDGESFHELYDRTLKFLERLKGHQSDETVMVVGHGGPLRIMVCHLLGVSVSHHWQFTMSRSSVSALSIYPNGSVLEKLNDMAHWKYFEDKK